MYTNFIYFIVVLLVFSTKQPAPTPRLSLLLNLAASIILLTIFAIVNGHVFHRLSVKMSRVGASTYSAVLYHRTVTRQSILALVFFSLHVYVLDTKYYLTAVPVFESSFTLQGLVAIILFLLHLVIIWSYSFACRCRFSTEVCSRSSVIRANLKFNLAILLPWILISGSFDLLQLLPVGSIRHLLSTLLGQVVLFALLLIIFLMLAPPLVVRLWNCRPLPPSSQRTVIETFCREEGFRVQEIVLWPSPGGSFITAGVMGLVSRFRYLMVTEGLLQVLDDEELCAVLAHEMGHVKEHHLFFYLIFLLGYLVLAYPLSGLSFLLVLSSDLPLTITMQNHSEFLTVVSVLTTIPLLLLLVFYFRFLFGFFIRNFERQADLYVFGVMKRPYPLISALEKVGFHSGNIRDVPSWHHFSIKQRVDFLAAAARDSSLLKKHSLKVKKALAGYLVGVTAVGVVSYLFYSGVVGKSFDKQLNITMLSGMVKMEPDNALLRLRLGTLYYTRNQPKPAVFQLQRALELDPDNPEILNNLAWIFATSKEDLFFQPERALALAERAADRSRKAHILDTLAEAYFVNGHMRKALAAAKEALALASGDRSYYVEQVERFRAELQKRQSD